MNDFNIIDDRLGKGSFGRAWLVERKSDKKKFVVKEVARDVKNKKKAEENAEVRILKSLKNPNIVRYVTYRNLLIRGHTAG